MISQSYNSSVSAAKELKNFFTKAMTNVTKEVAELLANDGTTVLYTMPSYGGLSETGIQSAKRHLTRINKDTKLTYEEIATDTALQDRQRYRYNFDTSTFLGLGEPLISVPDTTYKEKNISLMNRWHLIQKKTKDFWWQWKTVYLNTLQQRYKCQTKLPLPAVGDIVIVKDENTPFGWAKWFLAKVKHLLEQIYTGADDLVRVLTVQTAGNHELKIPLSKLILLPKDN